MQSEPDVMYVFKPAAQPAMPAHHTSHSLVHGAGHSPSSSGSSSSSSSSCSTSLSYQVDGEVASTSMPVSANGNSRHMGDPGCGSIEEIDLYECTPKKYTHFQESGMWGRLVAMGECYGEEAGAAAVQAPSDKWRPQDQPASQVVEPEGADAEMEAINWLWA
jgi:hypothetical protein